MSAAQHVSEANLGLFPSPVTFGGARNAVGPREQDAGKQTASGKDMPIAQGLERTINERGDQGVSFLGDATKRGVDAASGLGNTMAIGAYALTNQAAHRAGEAVIGRLTTQGESWSLSQSQQQQQGPQDNGAQIYQQQLAHEMHWNTRRNIEGRNIGNFTYAALGGFGVPDVPDVREPGRGQGAAMVA